MNSFLNLLPFFLLSYYLWELYRKTGGALLSRRNEGESICIKNFRRSSMGPINDLKTWGSVLFMNLWIHTIYLLGQEDQL